MSWKKGKVYIIGILSILVSGAMIASVVMMALGVVNITTSPLVLETLDYTFTYDGENHVASGYNIVSGQIDEENGEYLVCVGNLLDMVDVGTYYNRLDIRVYNSQKKDVTANYNISYENYGTVTINQRPITIKSKSLVEEYTGDAYYTNRVEVISGSLVSGHSVKARCGGKQTQVGTCVNTLNAKDVKIYDLDNNNVTSNYALTIEEGTITVY